MGEVTEVISLVSKGIGSPGILVDGEDQLVERGSLAF
jgi:hypothetical protein